jgi:hypothetical protein
MQPIKEASPTTAGTHPELSTTKITLYDLIDAISDEVKPGEDQLVVEVVLHLRESGRIKLLSMPLKVHTS